MSVKKKKQIMVDTNVLKDWMKKKNYTYKELATITGMSTTQAFNLMHHQIGGAVTLGYLATLGIQGLFYLAIIEEREGRKRVSDVIQLEVRAL